ncbi:MAG TPA: hypothetical protein VGD49_13040 [Longimicrobiales bacterium]
MTKYAIVATILLVSCSDSKQQGAASQANARDTVAACQQFAREGLKLKARNRAELDAEIGNPGYIQVTTEPNRHVPNAQDSIIRLESDGLIVQVRKPGPGGELFEQVEVSQRKWLNFPYFRPGVSASDVVAALGQPRRREANRLIYNCGESEAEEPIVFELEDGAVQRIVFNYYVD